MNELQHVLSWPHAELPMTDSVVVLMAIAENVEPDTVTRALTDEAGVSWLRDHIRCDRFGDPGIRSLSVRLVRDAEFRDWRGYVVAAIAYAVRFEFRTACEIAPADMNRRQMVLGRAIYRALAK